MKKKIAIIGVGNNIGREILMVLAEEKFSPEDVTALEFSDQKIAKISFGYENVISVQNVENYDFKNTDIVIITSIDKNIIKYINKAHEAGSIVIDYGNKFKLDKNSCLIVPEVNLENLEENSSCKTITIPRAIVSQIAIALKPLHDFAIIKRVVISTYQSVSDMGKLGLDELYTNTKKVYENNIQPPKIFPKQIAFNVIPQVGNFTSTGYTVEEQEISEQLKEIIDKDIVTTATCAYVPVFACHSSSINVEFKHPITVERAKKELAKSDSIMVLDRLEKNRYMTPIECAREDDIIISRIRSDETVKNGLSFWVVSDNIRRTAIDIMKVINSL